MCYFDTTNLVNQNYIELEWFSHNKIVPNWYDMVIFVVSLNLHYFLLIKIIFLNVVRGIKGK